MTAKQTAGFFNQKNGHKFEIKVWNKLKQRKDCLASCISSGSKGIFDIWGMFPNKTVVIVCRNNGYLTPKERQFYTKWFETKPSNVQLEFWGYSSPKIMRKVIIKLADQFINWSW